MREIYELVYMDAELVVIDVASPRRGVGDAPTERKVLTVKPTKHIGTGKTLMLFNAFDGYTRRGKTRAEPMNKVEMKRFKENQVRYLMELARKKAYKVTE